jgi:hypothetical protein
LGPNKEEQSWKLDRSFNEEDHQRKCQKGRIVPPKTAQKRGIYGQKMAKNGKNNLAGTIKGGMGMLRVPNKTSL